MTSTSPTHAALQARMATLLPELYLAPAQPILPTAMGSAGLQFHPDGRVAWERMWQTFCDLAMAGGPPHKGKLLPVATAKEAAANPGRTLQVAEEIARGITLATGLEAQPARSAAAPTGWVRVECASATIAAWLLRAITMENVPARAAGDILELPAAPGFRLEKEIKNVITVLAKTVHYWRDHMPFARQQAIAALFASMATEAPLIVPVAGWQPIELPTVSAAIEAMRAMVASNILARREATTLLVAVDPALDPASQRAHQILTLLAEGIR